MEGAYSTLIRFLVVCKYIIFILSKTIYYLNLHIVLYCIGMKKFTVFVLVTIALSVTGCDFFRKLAGRPTSEDIEIKRLEIIKIEQAEHQARLDSIKRAHQMMLDSIARLDSLAVLDSICQSGGSVLNPASLGGLFCTKLEARYYVIVGAFKSRANAEKLFTRVADKGYTPALITFRNGLIAVGLAPADNIKDAHRSLKEVRKEKFCPKGAWILLNE